MPWICLDMEAIGDSKEMCMLGLEILNGYNYIFVQWMWSIKELFDAIYLKRLKLQILWINVELFCKKMCPPFHVEVLDLKMSIK